VSSVTRGQAVIRFIELHCRAPEGEHVGKPIRLEPFQKRFLTEVYDNRSGTRRGYLSIARKNGKSALIAGILLAHLAGPEAKQNSQIVSGARSRDQAALVYSLAAKMVQMSPQLSAVVRIVPSSKRLVGLARNVEYRALAADGTTTHGLSPVLAILDEVGQIRGPQDDFVDAITTSQGAHGAPLLLAISTQAPNDNDLFSIWLDDAEASHDQRIVSHLYAADKECDLGDKAQWKKANPALGKFRSLQDVKEQAAQAARMPSSESTFRNLILNQRVESKSPFISRDAWKACGGLPAGPGLEPVYLGLDLSASADLTALVAVWRSGDQWHAVPYCWTPEGTIADRAKRDRAPYDVWAKDGHLLTTPGATVDYEFVARFMLDLISDWNVAGVAFDRWRIDSFKKALELQGASADVMELLQPFGQGFQSMAPAIDKLEAAILNGRLNHGNHPVLTMCASNSVIVRDPAGNRKLDKMRSTGRIDAMVALCMAIGASSGADAPGIGNYLSFISEQATA